MFDYFKKKEIENRENDALLFEYVLEEINNDIIENSLWAKAIAYSEGLEHKIQPLYMQYRVQSIKDTFVKLEIAYADLKKAILFEKITSIFHKSEEPKILYTNSKNINKPKIQKVEIKENITEISAWLFAKNFNYNFSELLNNLEEKNIDGFKKDGVWYINLIGNVLDIYQKKIEPIDIKSLIKNNKEVLNKQKEKFNLKIQKMLIIYSKSNKEMSLREFAENFDYDFLSLLTEILQYNEKLIYKKSGIIYLKR